MQVKTDQISVATKLGSLQLLKGMRYSEWFALGEFVDNSITSYMTYVTAHPDDPRFSKLRIDIAWDVNRQELRVEDNAAGIPETPDGWARALELGSPNPDPEWLSVYGYGMKAAAFWWAPALSLSSTRVDQGDTRSAFLDLDKMTNNGLDRVERKIMSGVSPDKHGTTIVLKGLNPGRSYPTKKTLGKVRSYLSSMYRVYLRGDEGFRHPRYPTPSVEIWVQGQKLEAPQVDFLVSPYWEKAIPPGPDVPIQTWKKPISIKIANNRSDNSSGEGFIIAGWVGILATMSADAGLFLMFRGKGLVGVGQGAKEQADTFKPHSIFGASNGRRFRRIIGEIDVSELGKTNTSDGIKFSSEESEEFESKLLEALRENQTYQMAENYRPQSISDYNSSQLNKLQESVDFAVKTVAAYPDVSDLLQDSPKNDPVRSDPDERSDGVYSRSAVPGTKESVVFSAVFGDPTARWLSIAKEGESRVIEVNMAHPYMQKFFMIPQNSPDGVFELAIRLAMAEIENPQLYQVRQYLNSALDRVHADEYLQGFASGLDDVD